MAHFEYFLSSIDDFSRKIWIYSLKRKFDIFDTLIQFQREVKRSMGLKILKCQSDGGEFTSEFIEYCRKNGIYREQTQARSPQQNGIVEQRNQSFLDMARCITTNEGVPPSLWSEAIVTAANLHNRLPIKSTPLSTPEELFSNHKPDLSHLRIFGCPAFVHDPTKIKDKFHPSKQNSPLNSSKNLACTATILPSLPCMKTYASRMTWISSSRCHNVSQDRWTS